MCSAGSPRLEAALVEVPFGHDRGEIIVHDELRKRRIAADVPLAGRVERLRIDLPNYIPQVEIAFPNILDVAAANVTQVAFFAARHGNQGAGVRNPTSGVRKEISRAGAGLVAPLRPPDS